MRRNHESADLAVSTSKRSGWMRAALTAPTRSDVMIAAVAAALELMNLFSGWENAKTWSTLYLDSPTLPAVYYVVGLAALAWRHFAPLPVFGVLVIHMIMTFPLFAPNAVIGQDYTPTPWAGVVISLAAVASDKPVRISVPVLLFALAVPVIAFGRDGITGYEPSSILLMGVVLGSGWFFGLLIGRNRRRISSLQQAQRESATAIEKERDKTAAELHDIVSHAVTVMTLHAAGARRIIDDNPARAAEALEVIERVGSQTMDELRRLLELIRANSAGVEMLHGLHDLEGLVFPVRSAGIAVQFASSGDPRPLDPSVDHAAFRVVQEALTNVTKHAGSGAEATVSLHWTDELLRVEVSDGGGSNAKVDSRPDYGLIGLSARVALVGGSLSYGPKGEGFTVRVELPIATQAFAPADNTTPDRLRPLRRQAGGD